VLGTALPAPSTSRTPGAASMWPMRVTGVAALVGGVGHGVAQGGRGGEGQFVVVTACQHALQLHF